MTLYTTDDALKILSDQKITSNMESLRRWLRNGTIKGISPSSKKQGWRISKEDLDAFIKTRVPTIESKIDPSREQELIQKGREQMWWDIASNHVFEERFAVKKSRLKECVEHRRHSEQLFERIWTFIQEQKGGYTNPGVLLLFDAFLFNNERIPLDKNFESKEEQILFALMEYCRRVVLKK